MNISEEYTYLNAEAKTHDPVRCFPEQQPKCSQLTVLVYVWTEYRVDIPVP